MTAPNRIRELRLAAGLTQVQAARKAKFGQHWWSQIETGDISRRELRTLRRVAKAIGCDVQQLI